MSTPEQTGRDAMMAEVEALNARIENVHQEVVCPRCTAGIGVRCVHVVTRKRLKHPHQQRIRAAGISLR